MHCYENEVGFIYHQLGSFTGSLFLGLSFPGKLGAARGSGSVLPKQVIQASDAECRRHDGSRNQTGQADFDAGTAEVLYAIRARQRRRVE